MRETLGRARVRWADRRRGAGIGLVLVSAVAAVVLTCVVGARLHPDADPVLQRAADAAVRGGSVGYLARVDDGRHVTAAAAGQADRATGRPLGPDDQFEIGSITKAFVATLALQLVGEGRLRLSDTVEHLLPGTVPGGDAITLAMLLQHTSGLYNYTSDPQFATSDPNRRWRPAELVAVATGHPPDFAPGTRWQYSNTNYVLVGMILQRVTGQPPAVLLRDRIARPLGLRHTYLVTDVAPATGLGYAHGYQQAATAGEPTYLDVSGWALGTWASTAGAVVSTAPDLTRFFSALLGGRLLPPAELARMRDTVPASGTQAAYGLGLMRLDTPCGTVWGHSGGTRGHLSTAYFSADGRLGAVTDATTMPALAGGGTTGPAIARAQLSAVCRMFDKTPPADAGPGS